jgi:hypothetical protein
MIYPSFPENPENPENPYRPVTVAKIVKENSLNSYVYVLNMNRKKSVWVHDQKVYFTFLKYTLEDYMAHFAGKLKNSSDRISNLKNTFPVSLRHIDHQGAYVFERPPFSNTFRYQPMRASGATMTNKEPLQFTVWFPWSIYVFPVNKHTNSPDYSGYPFEDPYVYFSSSKLNSFDQKLFPAPLPNIFSEGRVCMGNTTRIIHSEWRELSEIKQPTYADAFNMTINHLFSGGWNSDILPDYTIPPVMIYQNYRIEDHETKVKNHEYSSRISASRNSFVNYLKIWASMSLEEVLEAYQDERYSPTHYSTLENRDQLNSRNNSSAFSNVYSFYYTDPSEIFLYSRSIFSHTFTDSPFDNYSESAHEVLPQEHYYNILENLITHFEQQNSDNKFIEEPF